MYDLAELGVITWNAQRVLLVAIAAAAIGCAGDESASPTKDAGSNAADAQAAAAGHVFYEVDIDGRTAVLDLTPNDTLVGNDYRQYTAIDHGLEEMPGLTERVETSRVRRSRPKAGSAIRTSTQ